MLMLLSYAKLCELVARGIINADPKHINGSSIDITLDWIIKTEVRNPGSQCVVDLVDKTDGVTFYDHIMPSHGYILAPGEFILASSVETFNLPNNISAEYKLKSTMARNGLEHLNAGWCDAGWNNSKLTLELKNMTRHHDLIIRPGMKIGQIVFFEHEPVPEDKSYAIRGQYNGQDKVTGPKGLR